MSEDKDLLKPGSIGRVVVRTPEAQRALVIPKTKIKPSLDVMFRKMEHIIDTEIDFLLDKMRNGAVLTAAESQKVSRYVKSVVELAKEERAQEKHEQPSDLSDEQLLEILGEAEKVLKKENE